MKRTILGYLTLSLAIGFPSIGAAEKERTLFIAFAMTKAQEASSIPTDSGIYLRSEKEDSWHRIGPVIQSMNGLAVDPSAPATMFMACGNGIVRSKDGGENWRMVTGWRESDFLEIAIDPENGDNVYGTSVWGFHLSRDGGETWTSGNKGLNEKYCRTIIVDHRNTRRLLLGTGDGIYESRNGGDSWARVDSSPESAILRMDRSLSNPDLWIAGSEGEGVYLSTNDGKSWGPVVETLVEANVYGVSLHPEKESRMAAGGWSQGLWVSNDGGDSWEDRSSGLTSQNVTAVVFDENHPDRLWVSTFEEGTYYTDDDGNTWIDGDLYGAYVFDLDFVTSAEE